MKKLFLIFTWLFVIVLMNGCKKDEGPITRFTVTCTVNNKTARTSTIAMGYQITPSFYQGYDNTIQGRGGLISNASFPVGISTQSFSFDSPARDEIYFRCELIDSIKKLKYNPLDNEVASGCNENVFIQSMSSKNQSFEFIIDE